VTGGRPPLGPGLVEGLDASDEAKKRLKTVLETIGGARTVDEACEALGLSRPRYYQLVRAVLGAGAEALEPRPRGRPKAEVAEVPEVVTLRERVKALERDLLRKEVGNELATALSYVAERREVRLEKKTRKRRKPW
jgi:hypothetical protein